MITHEINAADAPAAPTYAQVMEVSGATRFVFISGQIPVTPDGHIPETFAEQSRLAWANVLAQLRASAMTVDNLVKVMIFLSDRRYIADYRKTRDEALGGRRIALTTIITGIFDEKWLLEIEAIAAA
jgi:2-iminobutanoate/2-iminopropanoate deaminase